MTEQPIPAGDPADEFEAIWAVVRRLESHIRRLEAATAALQAELRTLKGEGAAGNAASVPLPSGPDESARSSAYRLVFDGGSIGNPGRGYGSYHLTSPDGGTLHERLDFADRGPSVTNNQAEYLTLIGALERLKEVLGERARSAHVEVLGDSQLVINQLNGRWKVRNAELQPLYELARSLLAEFGRADLRWHDRSHSVELLGH